MQADITYMGGDGKDPQNQDQTPASTSANDTAATATMFDASTLPTDIDSLAQLRDSLENYLVTLEQNTQTVSTWLQKNESKIVDAHHKLTRALTRGQTEKETLTILSNMGELAGFVLSISDFKDMAVKAFGKDNAVTTTIKDFGTSLPASLLEELPSIEVSATTSNTPNSTYMNDITPEKVGFWSSMFGGAAKAEKRAQDAREQREREIRQKWEKIRAELISLQSERNYFVESAADSIFSGFLAESDDEANEAEAIAKKYQEPAYVIGLAQRDYAEVMEIQTARLREKAAEYSKIAGALDNKDPSALSWATMENFKINGAAALILNDPYYKGSSFSEIALNYFTKREDQEKILWDILRHEKIKFSGSRSDHAAYDRVMTEVLADKPLSSSVLHWAVKSMKANEAQSFLRPENTKAGNETYFERIAQRFAGDYGKMTNVLRDYMLSVSYGAEYTSEPVERFIELVKAIDTKNAPELARFFSDNSGKAAGVTALWNLCYPDRSLLSELSGMRDASTLIYTAWNAGMLDELKINEESPKADTAATFKTLQDKFLDVESTSQNLTRLRFMLGGIFANGGLERLRHALVNDDTRPGRPAESLLQKGWLKKIAMKTDLSETDRAYWIAALLEPFKSDITKANILAEAAAAKSNSIGFDVHEIEATKFLKNMEESFSSTNPRLGLFHVMHNLDQIANIWYKSDEKAIYFTINGEGNNGDGSRVIARDVTPHMAKEILTLLQRKGSFLEEHEGLFNPKKIDRFIETDEGPAISWHNTKEICLNITDQVMDGVRNRPDFLHGFEAAERAGETGNPIHINAGSITLIEPLAENKTLVLDKYGHYFILEGAPSFKPAAEWVSFGDAGYFNPAHVGYAVTEAQDNKVSFRIESTYFDQLLRNIDNPNPRYYELTFADKKGFKAAEDAFKKLPAVIAPASNTAGPAAENFYFNLSSLDYMRLISPDVPGKEAFESHKYGALHSQFITPLDKQLLEELAQAGALRSDTLYIEGDDNNSTLIAKASVQNIYYSDDKESLCIITDKCAITLPCSQQYAWGPLRQMAEFNKDMVVLNQTRTGVPLDLIDFKKSVALQYDTARDISSSTSANIDIDVALSHDDSLAMIDRIEATGLKSADSANPLGYSLNSMGQMTLTVKPALKDLSAEALLKTALTNTYDSGKQTRSISDEFRAAATYVAPKSSFRYPAQTPRIANSNVAARRTTDRRSGY